MMIRKLLNKIPIFLLIVVSILLILAGYQFDKISKKQYIYGKIIHSITDQLFQYTKVDSKYDFGNDFQVTATRKIDLTSEEYPEKSYLDPTYYKKNQMITKISRMDSTFQIKHSKQKGRLLIDIEDQIDNEKVLSAKYYVNDSTKYYFVNTVLENYINDGTSRYFETISNESTVNDNIDYMYQTIVDSFIKNIREEEIKEYDADITIDGNNQRLKQISLKVTDKYIKVLLKRVLLDLKENEKASLILENIIPDFKNTKVDEEKIYLENEENYNINVYVKPILYEPVKIEVIHLKKDEVEIYNYEGTLEKGLFYYSKNNELKYKADVTVDKKKTNIQVTDADNNSLGFINIEKASNSLSLNIDLKLEARKINLIFTSIFKNYKKDESYDKEENMNIKILNHDKITLSGTIEVNSTVTKDFSIEEDLENSILRSTLNPEKENQLKFWKETFKDKLES